MITITGESIWPKGNEHGDTGVPSLYSIGVGLGRTVRFSGQTRLFYTVLQHTLVVAELLPIEFRIHGLLHDAPEAIVGDVPTTWKTDAARDCEDDLQLRIYESLGLKLPSVTVYDLLHEADADALAAEAHVLGHAEAGKWWPWDEVNTKAYELTTARATAKDAQLWLEPDYAGFAYANAVHDAIKLILK